MTLIYILQSTKNKFYVAIYRMTYIDAKFFECKIPNFFSAEIGNPKSRKNTQKIRGKISANARFLGGCTINFNAK